MGAISIRPNAILAPNRKKGRNVDADSFTKAADMQRFEAGSRTRSSIQVAVYRVFDGLEAWTER